jgi:hypothetical protein
MALSMKLPNRFPVGTKFVIEGRPRGEGQVQIVSRYLEFPDGRCLALPPLRQSARRPRSRRGRKG